MELYLSDTYIKWGKPNFFVNSYPNLLKNEYLMVIDKTGNLIFTLTARSRRLKLLQKIRRLRDELGQPYEST